MAGIRPSLWDLAGCGPVFLALDGGRVCWQLAVRVSAEAVLARIPSAARAQLAGWLSASRSAYRRSGVAPGVIFAAAVV